MRAKVGEDQGSVEAINRAVYATCAALLWHHGLGKEALALVKGSVSTPSKVHFLIRWFLPVLQLFRRVSFNSHCWK